MGRGAAARGLFCESPLCSGFRVGTRSQRVLMQRAGGISRAHGRPESTESSQRTWRAAGGTQQAPPSQEGGEGWLLCDAFPRNIVNESSTYCSKHDSENQPSKAPQHNLGWGGPRGQSRQTPKRAQEDPQESCFQKLGLPSCNEDRKNTKGHVSTSHSPEQQVTKLS